RFGKHTHRDGSFLGRGKYCCVMHFLESLCEAPGLGFTEAGLTIRQWTSSWCALPGHKSKLTFLDLCSNWGL
ncbi:mCG8910, partial [Mus musculus]